MIEAANKPPKVETAHKKAGHEKMPEQSSEYQAPAHKPHEQPAPTNPSVPVPEEENADHPATPGAVDTQTV